MIRLPAILVALAALSACHGPPPVVSVEIDSVSVAPPRTEPAPGKALFPPYGQAEVKGVFERRGIIAADCHTAAGPSTPTSGRLVSDFVIQPNGTLSDVRVETSTPGLQPVAECLAKGLRASRLPFAAADARTTHVEWRLFPKETIGAAPQAN